MKVEKFLLSATTLALIATSAHALESTHSVLSLPRTAVHRPHFANQGCAPLSDTPDVFLERLDEEGQRAEIVGQRVLNDDAHETLTCAIAPGLTQNYLVHIKNWTQSATTFHVSLAGSLSPAGAETSWPAKGWQARVTYDDQTTDILAQLQSAQGWQTPRIDLGKETTIKIQLTAPTLATAPATAFRITARQGDKSDTVVGQVPIQAIAKLQWSVDDVTWADVTPATLIKVEQTDLIGLRAVKLHPDVDWPTSQPLGPTWTFHGDNSFGETVWFHAKDLTDGDSEEATATLVNTLPIKIKVSPGDAFATYDKDDQQ